jgi:hypothetical protein
MYIKTIAIIFVAGTLAVSGCAQVKKVAAASNEPQFKTKLEGFLAHKGIVVIKEFHSLGSIGDAKLDTLTLYEPGNEQQKIKGLRIEVKEGGSYGRDETSFLDLEEVDALVKGLDYIDKVATDWDKSNRAYTEIFFSTKGDFKVGFYIENGREQAFIQSGSIGSAMTFVSIKDLAKMRQMIGNGQSSLLARD